ncbi:MAG: benzoate/H(+) symporter BenE family transporter [Acidimicrobiia bacterium]|nr:benzoate/H(+) symporter BenE family transporter [Acidimicrobiia bacterium]
MSVILIAVLAIPLEAARDQGLSAGETASWIVSVYGVPTALAVVLMLRYRQPLLLTGNVFVLIFISRLGAQVSWAELIGASMVAGAVILLLEPLGLTKKLIAWLPAPIVFGLLAGAVLPFFIRMFTELGHEPILVGGTLLIYLLARVYGEPKIPAILPALVGGLLIAAISGDLTAVSLADTFTAPVFTRPAFSLAAILTVTPVMVVLIEFQANAPSIVFLKENDFEPPETTVTSISGLGTIAGSLLGPTGVSLSLPATALIAGPDAGEHDQRYLSAVAAAGVAITIAVLAGLAVQLATAIPAAFLATGVALAVIGILENALQRVTSGPLTWGPLFAFAIALSDLTLLGLGPFFWAIAGGLVVSLILERDQWKTLHDQTA